MRAMSIDAFDEPNGNALLHREKGPVTTWMNFYPIAVVGYGPIESRITMSHEFFGARGVRIYCLVERIALVHMQG